MKKRIENKKVQIEKGKKSSNRKRKQIQIEIGIKSPNRNWKK